MAVRLHSKGRAVHYKSDSASWRRQTICIRVAKRKQGTGYGLIDAGDLARAGAINVRQPSVEQVCGW